MLVGGVLYLRQVDPRRESDETYDETNGQKEVDQGVQAEEEVSPCTTTTTG